MKLSVKKKTEQDDGKLETQMVRIHSYQVINNKKCHQELNLDSLFFFEVNKMNKRIILYERVQEEYDQFLQELLQLDEESIAN